MAYQSTTISFGPRFAPRSAPLTFWFIVVAVTLWFLAFLAEPVKLLAALLTFQPSALGVRPWSVVTYPLANTGLQPFPMLLMGYVFWWSGAEVERWWGTRIHAVFLLVVSAVTALLLLLGGRVLGQDPLLMGAGIPLSAVLTIWSLRNLRTPIMLLFVPATGAVLLVLELLVLWFSFGPVLGLFAMAGGAGLPAAYFYWGHHLHKLFAGGGGKGDGSARRPAKPSRRAEAERLAREKRVADIFERSGLRVVDDKDRPAK